VRQAHLVADVRPSALRNEPNSGMAPTLSALTYATQVGPLKRYRTCGEQKVTVQHASVSAGAQAIVGNVTHYPCHSRSVPGARSLT
jgi:hypothetical protein